MSKELKQSQQQQELFKKIWDVACTFWAKMEADSYQDYVLGLLFYRYLSEKTERTMVNLLSKDALTYQQAWLLPEYKENIIDELKKSLGYVIEPQNLYSYLVNLITVVKTGFDIEYLQKSINSLMDSTMGLESNPLFDGVFEYMDLNSGRLGKTIIDKSKLIGNAIVKIGSIAFDFMDKETDVMGDAYEYMIGKFAAGAGKKAGNFFTPQQVSVLISKIVTMDRPNILNIFDTCGGSGSLLLTPGKYSNVRNYYYQDSEEKTFNLGRMNMMLHDVSYNNIHMANDDSLENPAFRDVAMDVCVSNPPYSQIWSAAALFLEDERFSSYGVLAPKNKADYAFLLNQLSFLKEDGIMAIVLPHGVLFRGGAEGKIRKELIKKNYIDTIIGLPANIFFGTTIPTTIMILKKNKKNENVLFIDAKTKFVKLGNRNCLIDSDINTIFEAYKNRTDIDKFAHVADLPEIEKNEFNLNISRYVDTFIADPSIDIDKTQKEIEDLNIKIIANDKIIKLMEQELNPKNKKA